MPPANPNIIAIRPRSLDTVLADLKATRRDFDDALSDIARPQSETAAIETADRATEAETRLEDLRAEFDARLIDVTGLTVEALMKAREECLI